jgi:hypothetical protein
MAMVCREGRITMFDINMLLSIAIVFTGLAIVLGLLTNELKNGGR